jgi:protein-tyrosine phosphatase
VSLPGDSYWVEEGRLLAGPYPGDPDLDREREKLTEFLQLGMKRFVDLTQPGEHSPYAPMLQRIAAEHGLDVHHTRMAVPDVSVPPVARMREILDLLDAELDRGNPVYLHCRGGAGRTGTVVGCFLIERGEPPVQALSDIAADRRDLHSKRRAWSSPETEEQRQFVLGWRSGRS